MSDLLTRVLARIEKREDGCWIWTGSVNKWGYGQVRDQRRAHMVHRVVFEGLTGRVIPQGFDIDHLCRVPGCCNPDHLEAVTHRENIRRGVSGAVTRARMLAKTHCPQGHPYSGTNLYVAPKTGARNCRTCRSEAGRQHRDRRGNRV